MSPHNCLLHRWRGYLTTCHTVLLMASSGTELANTSDPLTGQSFFPGLQQKNGKGVELQPLTYQGCLYSTDLHNAHQCTFTVYKYTTLKIALHLPCLILPIQVLQWPLSITCWESMVHHAHWITNESFEAGRLLWSNVELLQTANKHYIVHLICICNITYITPLKKNNMSPENQWLEDAFSYIEIVPF